MTVVALFSVGVWLFTVMVIVPDAVTPFAVPFTVTTETPMAVGVPEITPVTGFRDKPRGKVDATLKLVEENPAVAVGAAAAPADLSVNDAGPKVRVGAVTVREKEEDPVPAALAARRVTLKVPVWVGIPEITPVPVAQDRPVGSPSAE